MGDCPEYLSWIKRSPLSSPIKFHLHYSPWGELSHRNMFLAQLLLCGFSMHWGKALHKLDEPQEMPCRVAPHTEIRCHWRSGVPAGVTHCCGVLQRCHMCVHGVCTDRCESLRSAHGLLNLFCPEYRVSTGCGHVEAGKKGPVLTTGREDRGEQVFISTKHLPSAALDSQHWSI